MKEKRNRIGDYMYLVPILRMLEENTFQWLLAAGAQAEHWTIRIAEGDLSRAEKKAVRTFKSDLIHGIERINTQMKTPVEIQAFVLGLRH